MPKQNSVNLGISPLNIWGKVITKLKENAPAIVYVSCGEIEDVAVKGNSLIINCNTQTYKLLSHEQCVKLINQALHEVNSSLNVTLVKCEISNNNLANTLKELFGNRINIKGN